MSSKRSLRKKSCDGKQKYDTQSKAELAAKIVGKNIGGQWLTAYKCEFCGKYHIGHPPYNVRRSIISRKKYYE